MGNEEGWPLPNSQSHRGGGGEFEGVAGPGWQEGGRRASGPLNGKRGGVAPPQFRSRLALRAEVRAPPSHVDALDGRPAPPAREALAPVHLELGPELARSP